MLYLINQILNIEPYKITCLFNNNEIRQIDLEAKIKRLSALSPKLFEPLLDYDYFKNVKIESYGTLKWDNEVDFCPDDLYELSKPI